MTATGTFDGADFEVVSDPLTVDAGAQISDRPIPGGNITYRDVGGQTPMHWTYAVYTPTMAAFAALVAKRGVTGILTTTVDGTVTATLLSVRRSTVWPDGATEGSVELAEASI